MIEMKSMKSLILFFLIAACLLMVACRTHPVVGPTTTTSGSVGDPGIGDSTNTGGNIGVQPPSQMLEFHYGRLTMENRFVKLVSNGIDFTLNFDKKIISPGDDIVLTVYVANYTGDELDFLLESPIVSRQQLIHASLTYGGGEYSVPVTVDFNTEKDLVGGAYEVNIRNRKLLSTTVTFHTSVYENIEESIFNQDFANDYEMNFWFGEDPYTYRAETSLNFQEIDWSDPAELQSIILPESYVRVVGDLRFTVTLDKTAFCTDDDVQIHVTIENLGKEAIELYSKFDVSDPARYIRAEMTYGSGSAVRDNVASPAEIAGIESRYLLKDGEILEREIEFYTSEFQQIKRSVYYAEYRDQCVLKIWVTLAGEACEINVPITYDEYLTYDYQDREIPPIVEKVPELTETKPPQTTRPPVTTTEPSETTTEPEVTTTDPIETTVTPAETTKEPVETTGTSAETTKEPVETTVTPAETTKEPVETMGTSAETTKEPVETTVTPAETTKEPVETMGTSAETTKEPVETTVTPAETTKEPVETTVTPAETTKEPVETTVTPAETTTEPVGTTAPATETILPSS